MFSKPGHQTRMMTRRISWMIIAAVALLLVLAELAYWKVTAERLRTGYQNWVAARIAQGWNVGSGMTAIGGWPRAATVTVPNLTVRHAGPTIPGKVDVASAQVTLSVSLLDPTYLRLSLTGPTHVRVGELPDVIVTGDETAIFMPLKRAGSQSVLLHASRLRLEAATGAWHATVGLLNGQAAVSAASAVERSQPAAIFTMSSEAIALPAAVRWPLGRNISSLSVDGRLNGPVPTTSDIKDGAEAWRDGGGSLAISRLTMGWGPLGLSYSARLALDEQLQPMGSGNGRIVGYAETLDRLAAGGILTKSAATVAKAVLLLIAGTSDKDEPPSVDVPLTLQYRTLSMRQVPLVRLPELDWPAR